MSQADWDIMLANIEAALNVIISNDSLQEQFRKNWGNTRDCATYVILGKRPLPMWAIKQNKEITSTDEIHGIPVNRFNVKEVDILSQITGIIINTFPMRHYKKTFESESSVIDTFTPATDTFLRHKDWTP